MGASYFSNDTIAAIATSLAGDGGVGIIRLSGPEALSVAQSITKGFESPEPRFLHRIEVLEGSDVVDDGLAVFFEKKASFTGEPVVELQLHGGRFLLQSILKRMISGGKCRLALPGEFSLRSVRNGKRSLQDAQAIKQIIESKSLFEVRAARKNLGRARTEIFDSLRKRIETLLVKTELSIDFSDQDVEVISVAELSATLEQLSKEVHRLLAQLELARRVARGIQITLAGSPNAGKSTLFNSILSEDRAIVSSEAGTTRDVITEEFTLGPYFVRLADTAGIRESKAAIEAEGISRTHELVQESDLVIWVVDGLDSTASAPAEYDLVAINKLDRMDSKTKAAIGSKFKKPHVFVSAVTGEGISELQKKITETLDSKFDLGSDLFLPTEIQLQTLQECAQLVDDVRQLVQKTGTQSPELISAQLLSAANALAQITGETTPDDLLGRIFSEFCIGK